MITPFFTITQDDEFIRLQVKISHARFNAKTIEMVADSQLFIFSLPPYYLRLRFPYNCVDDERSHAEFDSKNECVDIRIPKETKGQDFPDLDLTAKLLARNNEEEVKKPLIQELDNNDIEQVMQEGEDFNWEISQDNPEEKLMPSTKYGFDNQYNDIVGVSISNGNDINELGDPENTDDNQRILERLIKENIKFDPEYYASDYLVELEDEDYKQLIQWKNPVTAKFMKWYKNKLEDENIMPIEFTKTEQEKMLDLPKKSYLLSTNHKTELLVLLVSLLFSYHFDMRETDGEHNTESAWTIGKLTPQLSFLDSKLSIKNDLNDDNLLRSAVITGIRRSLCYPLHRNYNFAMKCWNDVYYNLRGGKRLIIQSLIDCKELFRFHDVYYVYDKIWLQDLTSWIINDVNESMIRVLAHDLKRELDKILKEEITFEKLDPSKMDEGDSDDEDDEDEDEDEDMILLNLKEIELMTQ